MLDLVRGRGGISLVCLRFPARSSWGLETSADEGAVEALLCLDEAVDVALVVLDEPLPLLQSVPRIQDDLEPCRAANGGHQKKNTRRRRLPIRVQPREHIIVCFWVRVGWPVKKLPTGAVHLNTTIEGAAVGWLVTFENTKGRLVGRRRCSMKVVAGRFPPSECIWESRHVGGVGDVIGSEPVRKSRPEAKAQNLASGRDVSSKLKGR